MLLLLGSEEETKVLRSVLRDNRTLLCDCMNLKTSVLSRVFEEKVLVLSQVQFIQHQGTDLKQNEQLLDDLALRPGRDILKFMAALCQRNQSHLVTQLKGKLKYLSYVKLHHVTLSEINV